MPTKKAALAAKIEKFLHRFDPEEFSEENSGDRAKTLAEELAEELLK